jgi:hypothetical protein
MAEVGDVRGLRGLEEEGLLRLGLLTVGTGSLPFALVGTVVPCFEKTLSAVLLLSSFS